MIGDVRLRAAALAACVSVLAGGCTHLEVDKHTGNDPASRNGYAYMLDFTQYEIVLTRTLLECPTTGDPPKVKVEATVTPRLVPDGEQVYVINPESMISAFKTSDISIDYKDGRLVGFNATTVDKTGEFVQSVAATAGKLAMLATGVPLPTAAAAAAGPTSNCTSAAESNLNLIENSKKPMADATASLDDARAQLTVLTSQYAEKPTEALRRKIRDKTKDVEVAQKSLEAMTKTVTTAKAWLTDTMTLTWPQQSTVFEAGPSFSLPKATSDKWFRTADIRTALAVRYQPAIEREGRATRLRNLASDPDGNAAMLGITDQQFAKAYPTLVVESFDAAACTTPCPDLEKLKADLAKAGDRRYARIVEVPISLRLRARGSYGGEGGGEVSRDRRAGLRYRVPAAGTLYVCEDDSDCHSGTGSQPIAKFDGAIAQLGTVFNIPFSSPAFASGGVSVTFDDQGRLLKAGLKRTNSAALDAAGAAGAIADQAVTLATALQNEELTELQQKEKVAKAKKALADAEEALVDSPAEALQKELTLLEVQEKVNKARAALSPTRTQELTTELGIAKLELDLAEVREKLIADPSADELAVKKQYEAETLVLNARKSALEAEAAVIKAERELAKVRIGT